MRVCEQEIKRDVFCFLHEAVVKMTVCKELSGRGGEGRRREEKEEREARIRSARGSVEPG
jgi:hypothetical protein